MAAVAETFTWARNHPDEACTLHVKRVPEVAHDDCLGSLRAVVTYVFNDHSKQTGLGKHDPHRLKFTCEIVAEAPTLDPKWDFAQAVGGRTRLGLTAAVECSLALTFPIRPASMHAPAGSPAPEDWR